MPTNDTIRQRKYDDAHCRRFALKFSITSDADILEQIDAQKSKQGYIRALIREDIDRQRRISIGLPPEDAE